jgi:hypothetical protein
MNELRETIRALSDTDLLTAFTEKAGEYTQEALAIIKQEVEGRGLDPSQWSKNDSADEDEAKIITYKTEDLIEFEHSFSRTDLLLASAILRENAIPFFPNNPTSSDILPTENELERRYTIRIPKIHADRVHELLDEHFIKSDNKYLLKYSAARDRLRAFNFHDIHLTENESFEELEVALSTEEKRCVITLGRRLLKEAEAVEKAQDRVLFYYDSIEPLIEVLDAADTTTLTRNDLLAMLEILQVYIDDPMLPSSMDDAISSLLGFFIGP